MDCGKGYESGEGVGEVFVVLRKATVAAEPGKGSLDDPSTGQHDEAFRVVRALDDFEPEPRRSRDGVFDLVSVVARVGPDKLQPGKALADLVEDEGRAIAILDARRMDDHAQRTRATNFWVRLSGAEQR